MPFSSLSIYDGDVNAAQHPLPFLARKLRWNCRILFGVGLRDAHPLFAIFTLKKRCFYEARNDYLRAKGGEQAKPHSCILKA
jgi:hypothetical protein